MSHSIIVYNERFNRRAYLRMLEGISASDPTWDLMYSLYTKNAYVASLDRTAGDPLNQVLYIALGVMDEAYRGDSGSGDAIEFERRQLLDAIEIIERKSFKNMTRERSGIDDLRDELAGMGHNATLVDGDVGDDVTPELQFLRKCCRFMDTHGLKTIKVEFN